MFLFTASYIYTDRAHLPTRASANAIIVIQAFVILQLIGAFLKSHAAASWVSNGAYTNVMFAQNVSGTAGNGRDVGHWATAAGGSVSYSNTSTGISVAVTDLYCESSIDIYVHDSNMTLDALSFTYARSYCSWSWNGPPGSSTTVSARMVMDVTGEVEIYSRVERIF
jgi:hypothetical protein